MHGTRKRKIHNFPYKIWTAISHAHIKHMANLVTHLKPVNT